MNVDAKPYQGTIVFTNQTLSFSGTTIQLRNVTRLGTYIVKQPRMPIVAMILCSFLFIVTIMAKGLLIFAILTGAILAYGVYKNTRPKLYALLIELNSSYHHVFSSTDQDGIFEIHKEITAAMNNEKPINQTVYFKSDKIIFGDHVARDKYEVNDSTIGNMGSFENNPERS